MSELYDQIVNQRGTLRNWMDKIPGLSGYMDRKDHRTADRMVREHIAQQLQQRLDRFSSLESRILDGGGLSSMSETREAKTKLQTYHDRVKAAAPGYSGFFAAQKVDAEALGRLYAFDEAQVRYLAQIDEKIDAVEAAIGTDGLGAAVRELYDLAAEANRAFDLREDVLTNLNKTYS